MVVVCVKCIDEQVLSSEFLLVILCLALVRNLKGFEHPIAWRIYFFFVIMMNTVTEWAPNEPAFINISD